MKSQTPAAQVRQSFAQISDPHLSTLDHVALRDLLSKRGLGYLSWRQRRRHEHRREVLDLLQVDLRRFSLDQLLVTGDLTHIGLPDEFAQARNWLRDLGDPTTVAVVPGNHDACVATTWRETYSLWQDYMASDSQQCAQSLQDIFPSLRVRGNIAFIGLCTACPKPPFLATGTVGGKQLASLPGLLQAASQKGLFRVVHLHHSPLPGHEKWRKRLTDAAAVKDILERHGAEMVVHGHGHRSHLEQIKTASGTTPVVAVPSASARGELGNRACYHCYHVQRDTGGWQLEIEERCYDESGRQFIAGKRSMLSLARPAPSDQAS